MDNLFAPVGGLFRIMMNEIIEHGESVERYIQTKVDDLCKARDLENSIRTEIVKELGRRSAGIYLLASLTLKSLEDAEASKSNIRSVIQTLPGSLQKIYSDALDKVASTKRLRVAVLLLWVVFAVRPLRKWELSIAVTITCEDLAKISNDDLEDKVASDILGETGVRELVGPVIRVTGGDLVSLVHSSARQYLLGLAPNEGRHKWVWGWVKNRRGWEYESITAMASRELSLDCQQLISFASRVNTTPLLPGSASTSNVTDGIRPLLHYAIENLPDHFRQAPPGREMQAVFASFLESNSGRRWMREFWILKDPTQTYKELSPLEFCCALGLVEIVKHILPLDQYPKVQLSDVKGVKSAKDDATHLLAAADLAAMFGNVEILRVLCEDMGTPTNSDDLIPQTSWKATPIGFVHIGQNLGHYDVPVPARGTKGEDVVNERQKAVEQLSRYCPLHTATAYGHADAAEYLISREASISRQDENGQWAIDIAIEKKIEGLVQLLLRHHQHEILLLLHHFIEVGKPGNIERLIQLRPELLSNGVHFKTGFGEHDGSMLHVSASAGSFSVYKLLVQLSAEPRVKDSEGRQAIHYAAASGQSAFIESILADGSASKMDEDASSRNCLFYATLGVSCCDDETWASAHQRQHVISTLVGNASTTVSNVLVRSALQSLAKLSYHASSYKIYDLTAEDRPDVVFEKCLKFLLSKAPDITLGGGFLHAAFESTSFPLDVAVDLAANADETDSKGRTAIHSAAAAKREWTAWHEKLAARVTNIDQQDADGLTALHVAISAAEEYNVLPRVKILLERGADPNCADVQGESPFTAAVGYLLTAPGPEYSWGAAENDGLLTALLLRYENGVESMSDEVLPRLIAALAKSTRHDDLTSLLKAMSTRQRNHFLQAGLDTVFITAGLLFTCDEVGWPPETLSVMARHLDNPQLEQMLAKAFQEKRRGITEMCRSLLKDADVSLWIARSDIVKHVISAAQQGDRDTIELFVEVVGGAVDTKDARGQTMLSHAVETGRVELTKYLLSCDADSSIPDAKGKTAVYWGAREGKLDTLKLLVEAFAPVTDADIEIAKERGKEDVRTYLEKHRSPEAPQTRDQGRTGRRLGFGPSWKMPLLSALGRHK